MVQICFILILTCMARNVTYWAKTENIMWEAQSNIQRFAVWTFGTEETRVISDTLEAQPVSTTGFNTDVTASFTVAITPDIPLSNGQ